MGITLRKILSCFCATFGVKCLPTSQYLYELCSKYVNDWNYMLFFKKFSSPEKKNNCFTYACSCKIKNKFTTNNIISS